MSVFGKDEAAISKFAAGMPLPEFDVTNFSQPVSPIAQKSLSSLLRLCIGSTGMVLNLATAMLTLKHCREMREIWQLVTIASTLIEADLPRISMWFTPLIDSKRCEKPKSLGALQTTITLLRVTSQTLYRKSGWTLGLFVPRPCWTRAWMWCCSRAPDPFARVL